MLNHNIGLEDFMAVDLTSKAHKREFIGTIINSNDTTLKKCYGKFNARSYSEFPWPSSGN